MSTVTPQQIVRGSPFLDFMEVDVTLVLISAYGRWLRIVVKVLYAENI